MTTRTYEGGCHCGKVRFKATMEEVASALSCNCSICSKKGALLTFVPRTGFEVLSGEDELTDYQFNRNVIHHLFCKTCGVQAFGRGVAPDGTPMAAINVRCLDGVDLDKVALKPFDGRSM